MLTDEHMQTSVPGVYAAGDCAEAFDKFSGKTVVSAIQPNAADQGRVAGLNMAGHKAELNAVTQINVLDTLGLISASFGDWQGVPGGQHVELTDRETVENLTDQFLRNDCNLRTLIQQIAASEPFGLERNSASSIFSS